MESGCQMMFQQNKTNELITMYSVFSRVQDTLVHMIDKMQPYVEEMGSLIVMNEANLEDPLLFTRKLLKFKNEIDKTIEECFQNDIKFQKARDMSF